MSIKSIVLSAILLGLGNITWAQGTNDLSLHLDSVKLNAIYEFGHHYWDSNTFTIRGCVPGDTYLISYSNDLINWNGYHGFVADGTNCTLSFIIDRHVITSDIPGADHLFFRVDPYAPSPSPTVSQK